MLNDVIFMINNYNYKLLSEKCRQRGLKIFNKIVDEDSSVVVTDDPDLAHRLQLNMPVLFYDPDDSYPFMAKYVTDDIDSIDPDYLETIFCRFHGLPLIIAITDRTVIREITEDDLPELYEIYDDDFVTKYVEELYEYDDELQFTRDYIKNMYGFYGYGLWLVFDKETGKLAGRAGLSNRTIDDAEQVELGYVISKEFRNRGYAAEVCEAILKYASEQLKMEEIYICTDKDNLPSLRLARKLGFDMYGSVIYGKTEYYLYKKTIC